MTISMSQVQTIRQLKREGETVAGISRKVGVSRDTVYKYLEKDDFSLAMPVKRPARSIMDEYRPIIEGYFEEDSRSWRKQRHTAKRIYERLRDEHGCTASESTVRHYVARLRREYEPPTSSFLTLVWAPGEAQADFGEADFYVRGVRTRLSYFVLSFPFSNVGVAQVFASENAECVCQALRNIFEFLSGVPTRIVFDNATGVGRRVCGAVSTTDTFSAFAAHYGFDFRFCNPEAGHEKSNVERKVGYIRDNLFVPVPRVTSLESYNARLMGLCMGLSEKDHWRKGEPESQLFVEDSFAMAGLPERPFRVVRWVRPKANRQGKFSCDGPHWYSSDPSLAGQELIVGLGATTVEVYTSGGAFVCAHERAYGGAPTDSSDPASQLPLLAAKAGGWHESRVRAALPDELRGHMDALDRTALRAELRIMRDQCAHAGWDPRRLRPRAGHRGGDVTWPSGAGRTPPACARSHGRCTSRTRRSTACWRPRAPRRPGASPTSYRPSWGYGRATRGSGSTGGPRSRPPSPSRATTSRRWRSRTATARPTSCRSRSWSARRTSCSSGPRAAARPTWR